MKTTKKLMTLIITVALVLGVAYKPVSAKNYWISGEYGKKGYSMIISYTGAVRKNAIGSFSIYRLSDGKMMMNEDLFKSGKNKYTTPTGNGNGKFIMYKKKCVVKGLGKKLSGTYKCLGKIYD